MSGRLWTPYEDEVLRSMYPDHFAGEISGVLGRTVRSIYTRVRMLGLKSPREKIVRSGKMSSEDPRVKAARFRKGHVPVNKGKRMSPELYAKCAPTMFRKGNRPVNHRQVGSERVNVEGYVEVKVSEPNKWRLKHRVVWEQANGPIPPGHNVQFRDGNRRNCGLDNLYLISRADQLRNENSMEARYPEELRSVIRLRGTLIRQITIHNRKQRQ